VLLIVCAVIVYVALYRYVAQKAGEDTRAKSDVIIVLGGRVISGTDCTGPICKQIRFVPKAHYNPCVVARVDQAVSLYNAHLAPKILLSGGDDKEDNVNEAETMKKIAIDAGVPVKDILLEKKSTSTYENLLFSQKVLTAADLHSAIIVTDPYANARAGLVASKLQYSYSLSPAVKSPCSDRDQNSRNFRKEVFKLVGYKILNQI
jgi:uncharacterized SAM-binding protein YcdF (DUF218 family)